MIKSGGDVLTLNVISVTAQVKFGFLLLNYLPTCRKLFSMKLLFQEAERLEPSEDQANYNCIDYSEKRSLPISIPDYHYMERDGERFAVSVSCFIYYC